MNISNSFIGGFHSPISRQRLQENNTLDLQTMFDQTRSLEAAQKNSDSYNYGLTIGTESYSVSTAVHNSKLSRDGASSSARPRCYFSGF